MLYFCNGFFDFTLKGKSLLEYTHLVSPNEYKKNKMLKCTAMFPVNMENLNELKCHIYFLKTSSFPIV